MSNCLAGQGEAGLLRHGRPSLTMAFRTTRSFPMQATDATFSGLPARIKNPRITGFHLVAANVAMYSTVLTKALPPLPTPPAAVLVERGHPHQRRDLHFRPNRRTSPRPGSTCGGIRKGL